MSNEIGYWYPNLTDPSEENKKKKFEDGFMSQQEAYDASKKMAISRESKKSDIIERDNSKLLTNDGRELLI